jgi:hypothetical protein
LAELKLRVAKLEGKNGRSFMAPDNLEKLFVLPFSIKGG